MRTVISSIASREAFFKGQGITEPGIPWLSFGAIMALEHILKPDMIVLELGSGGSTLFFADRVFAVDSKETDKAWCEKMKQLLKHKENVSFMGRREQDIISLLNAYVPESYDIALVDTGWINGTERKKPDRLSLALAASPLVAKGGYLILDNYEKYGLAKFPTEGWSVYTFDDFGYSGRGTKILKKL